MRACDRSLCQRCPPCDLGCPHLRFLVVALGDLVVGDVHQPHLRLLLPGLAAEDLDKTAGQRFSVQREEEEEEEDVMEEEKNVVKDEEERKEEEVVKEQEEDVEEREEKKEKKW